MSERSPAMRRVGSMLSAACIGLSLAACEPAHAPVLRQTHAPAPVASGLRVHAEAWPHASLFGAHGAWLGADGAYSIDLGAGRTLWLFGDTFIDPAADGTRENGPNFFVRNSCAVQSAAPGDADSGYDPARAQMKFYWGEGEEQIPASFFSEQDAGKTWLWPLHGARLPSGELLLFRMRVAATTGGFGFSVIGWDAVAIDDANAEPSTWKPRVISAPDQSQDKLLGSSVMSVGDYLYTYAVKNSPTDHSVYLARYALASLAGLPQGALARPQWWCDLPTPAFAADCASPRASFADGQVELSVHFDTRSQRYVEIQMRGLFLNDPNTALALRTAERPEGPWSPLTAFYRPPEASFADASSLVAYAAKAHPEAHADGVLITYAVNDIRHMPPRDALYYPQAVSLHIEP